MVCWRALARGVTTSTVLAHLFGSLGERTIDSYFGRLLVANAIYTENIRKLNGIHEQGQRTTPFSWIFSPFQSERTASVMTELHYYTHVYTSLPMSVDSLTNCELATAQTDYVACSAYVEQNEDGLNVTDACPEHQ